MSVKLADTLKPMGDFPAAMAEDVNLIRKDGSEDSLQTMYENGELGGGGSGLPLPVAEDMLLMSKDKTRTSNLEWVQVPKSEIVPSEYGTKEEFKAKKDDLPVGTVFTITDDFEEFIDDEIVSANSCWSSNQLISYTGELSDLLTGNKQNLVASMNEIYTMAKASNPSLIYQRGYEQVNFTINTSIKYAEYIRMGSSTSDKPYIVTTSSIDIEDFKYIYFEGFAKKGGGKGTTDIISNFSLSGYSGRYFVSVYKEGTYVYLGLSKKANEYTTKTFSIYVNSSSYGLEYVDLYSIHLGYN